MFFRDHSDGVVHAKAIDLDFSDYLVQGEVGEEIIEAEANDDCIVEPVIPWMFDSECIKKPFKQSYHNQTIAGPYNGDYKIMLTLQSIL